MRWLAILLMFMIALSSCKKKCRYIKLGSTGCEEGYQYIENVQGYIINGLAQYPEEVDYVVNDTATYNSLFTDQYGEIQKPFGEINFTTFTLLGMDVHLNPHDYRKEALWLCNNEDKWVYTVKYSLQHQCAGSKISSRHLGYWLVVPKIPLTDEIQFNRIDVNPFN